jgi:hypothetical protein
MRGALAPASSSPRGERPSAAQSFASGVALSTSAFQRLAIDANGHGGGGYAPYDSDGDAATPVRPSAKALGEQPAGGVPSPMSGACARGGCERWRAELTCARRPLRP